MVVYAFKIVLLFVALSAVSSRDEIPDFEFDESLANNRPQEQRESSFTFDDFDDFFSDDDDGSEAEYDIATKEKLMHQALFKALAVKQLKYKFSEVIPLLRALSKSQRMVFASIISAQINGDKPLTLDEVKNKFGDINSRALLLPIVYDLANLVREGFMKSDKYQEHEKQDKNQILRRSFNSNSAKATKEVEFSAPYNSMRAESLFADEDDEPVVKENEENFDEIKPQPLLMLPNDSYHHPAVDSPLMSISLRKANDTPTKNLTLEEIENLAFSGLNASVIHEPLKDGDGTIISPVPLIGRYRKKGILIKGPFPERCERFTGGLCLNAKDYPTSEIMGSINRHRYAMEALLAEYRDKTAELEQLDYLGDPTSDLSDLRRREDTAGGTSSPGAMCTSIIRYARPQKARSATGEWKFIVNTGEHTQTLRLEKCSQPLEPCSYLTENFESSCTQVYNYHRLLSWDNTRGLHVDIFKVPTCCSCHLNGYKEAFPPLGQPSNSISNAPNNLLPAHEDVFSASSNTNSQYSTVNESNEEPEEEDEDTNIAYQFGNGFKRIKPKKSSTQIQELEPPPKSRPANKRIPTFLTPPANNKDSNFPFTNRGSNRQRTPTLKRKQFDQNYSESETISSRIQFSPQKPFSPSERPRKIIPPLSSTVDSSSVNLRLPNAQSPEQKRINYNYHPIIDFFEDGETAKNGIDRKTGKVNSAVNDNSWMPMVNG